MCHAHHITHWIDGGETSLHNMLLLCGHHHRLIHSGPWEIITTAPGQFEFIAPGAHARPATARPPPRE